MHAMCQSAMPLRSGPAGLWGEMPQMVAVRAWGVPYSLDALSAPKHRLRMIGCPRRLWNSVEPMPDESSLQRMLDFFRLETSDLEALSTVRQAIEANAGNFVDQFYDHLMQFPATRELLHDDRVRKHLLKSQSDYLISLTDPTLDAGYIEERERVGATHERVGLDTQSYLGAYSLYFSLLFPLIQDEIGDDPERLRAVTTALTKRLLVDASVATGQYIDRREDDLRRLNHQLTIATQMLSKEVDETTEDLRQTRVRAVAAEQLASVATLVTGLAHEIGTPMGVLRGHAEALESAVEGERAQWRLQMILEQIDRITSIIQSLLNIARPRETLRIPLELNEIVDTSLAFLAEKLRRRDVTVQRTGGPHKSVLGDPEKMQQVLLNLFINAIDSMPEGGTLGVTIKDSGEAHDEEHVMLCVSDSGNGMTGDELANIFDPFYTTKAAGHGNGLGLVVVQNIVEEHAGEIEVQSEPGQGSEFTIRLPALL